MDEEKQHTTWENIELLARDSVVLTNFLILIQNNQISKNQALLDMVSYFVTENNRLTKDLIRSKMREMPGSIISRKP